MYKNYIYILLSKIVVETQQLKNINEGEKEKIYIIGNGWASFYFVKNLDKKKYEPIIIAPNNKVLNTPKLIHRILDEKANVEFKNPYGTIINDILEDIDIEKKILITKSQKKYNYKKVVLAIGSEPNDFNIEGVNEYTYKLKKIEDADILRDKIKKLSNNSNIYIIGSGITGVELSSNLGSRFNINLIEGMNSILPGYNEKTKKVIEKYLKENFNNVNFNIKINHLVKNIDNEKIMFSILNEKKETELIKYKYNEKDIIIWTGGVRFNGYGKTKLFYTLNKITPIKPRGLDVNMDFSIGKDMGIYCIGDMVANAGPPTAKNAKYQGRKLSEYFNSGDKNVFEKKNKEILKNGRVVRLKENEMYLESDYYSGFVPYYVVDKIIDWL